MTNEDQKVGVTEDGRVAVRLAHPLREADRVPLGLADDVAINVNDVITVDRNAAINLIGAGMVQVNPDDHAAVTTLLTGATPTVSGEGTDVTPSLDPPAEGTGGTPAPAVLGAEAIAALKGADLDAALDERDLSKSGSVDEKRQRLSDYVVTPA